jgi:regulatory protein
MKSARAVAMDYLARREHARAELKSKLLQKSFEETEVEQALDQLQQENLQNDARFTEFYIYSHANQGRGPLKIRQGLQRSGVDELLIEQMMQDAEVDWQACVRRVWRKKFTNMPDSLKEKARQQRFLQQRGFGFDLIQAVFKEEEML